MKPRIIRIGCWAAVAFLAIADVHAQTPIPIAQVNRSEPIDFELEVLPILKRSCLACHNSSEAYGELVLETPATIGKGGDSGPAVVAGDGAASLLLKVASHQSEPIMPPPDNDVGAKTLTTQELGLLKLWIDQGATGMVRSVISPKNWRPLPPGVNPIYAATITRDGQFVACGRANQIFIYHAPTGQLVTRLTDPALLDSAADSRPGIAHRDLVQSLAFNRAGDLLASGGFRTAKIWRRPRDIRRLELASAASVTAVAASQDGSLLATAAGNAIQLWNRQTGEPTLTFEGHTAEITALAFLPGSETLVSAAADKSIRFWNTADATLQHRLDTPSVINDLTLVDGGRGMATAHEDNLLRYWSVPSGQPERPAETLADATRLAVSADGQLVASADPAGLVRVADAGCGQQLDVSWQAHQGPLVWLSFSANSHRLVTAGADGSVRVWDYETGQPVTRPLLGTLHDLTAAAMNAAGNEVASATAGGAITVWDLEVPAPQMLAAVPKDTSDESVAELAESDGAEDSEAAPPLSSNGIPATVAAVSPDGKLLATAGESAGRPAIFVRELATGRLQAALAGHTGPVTALAFAGDNRRLLSGSADGTSRIWDVTEPKFPELGALVATDQPTPGVTVTGVTFNADATLAVTCSTDQSAFLWDVATAEIRQSFSGHTGSVVGVAITPNGQQVITASADKTIRFWNSADGQLAKTVTLPAAITKFAASRDTTRVAAAMADHNVAVVSVGDGSITQTLNGHNTAVAALSFSTDGTRLLSASAERAVVWQTADGRLLEILPVSEGITAGVYGPLVNQVVLARADTGLELRTLRFKAALGEMQQAVTAAEYAGDGSLYTAGADGMLRRFTPANGQQVFAANHGSPVNDLALSPDGQLLASAGDDQAVKLWTASNGAAQPNPQLGGFTAAVTHVEFSRDGSRLVAAGAAGEVMVFHVASRRLQQIYTGHAAKVQALACAGAGMPLVVSAAGDSDVRQWEILQHREIPGHSMPLTAVATIDATPPQAITGSLDGTVRHWNLVTGQAIRTMNHGAPVHDVAVRPDGQRFASVAENNTARLWNAANGASVAELKGDIRSLNALARAEQELALITKKVEATKEALTAAEEAAPVKSAAAKAAADALTAANTAVTQAEAALKTVAATKAAAEEKAVVAAAAAQAASAAKLDADRLAKQGAEEAARAADKVVRAKAALQAAPDNSTLAAAVTAAEQASVAATAKAKAATDAAAKADAAAKTAAAAAATAAQQAVATGKPYTDAVTALRDAMATQNTAAQASALAASEAKKAADAVPLAQAELKRAEDRMAELTTQVAAAKEVATAAEQPIRTVAFSPDNRLLASGGDSMAVHTWSAEDGRAVASFHGHSAPVRQVLFTGTAELLSGAADNAAFVWDAEPGWVLQQTIGSIDDPTVLVDRVMDLDFSSDGAKLLVGGGIASRGGEVKLFNVADGSVLRTLPEPHTDGVLGVAFSPDGSRMATCGADKYVKIFDTESGELIRALEGHTDYVLQVAWRGDGRLLASCGADATIRVWNTDSGELTRTITGFEKQVTDIVFVGDSINTASSSGDKTVRLHRTDNGQNFRNFAGATDFVYCVDATPDSRQIVAGGFDSVLRIWDGANGQLLHELAPPAPSPSEETLAAETP